MHRDYWPTREWRTIEPADAGLDPGKLKNLGTVIESKYNNIDGIVLVRKGYIVFERYYNGCDPLDAKNVFSITKSVISALIGIALEEGYIRSIDQKVLDFFPEYVHGSNDIRKHNITIKHLLTMTAPFPFAWKEGDCRGREPLDRLRRQRDWVTYILNLMGQNGQPGRFQYYTAGAHLLSAIISRTTGMCAREFANARLFRPIGMKEIPDHEMKSWGLDDVFGKNLKGWIKDPQGYTVGGLGLTLTPRDMARFGFLYLNRGFWDNKQVVSEIWVDKSTDVSIALNPKEKGYNGYGYLWWCREVGNTLAYLALGDGGNVICCIPDKDIVVAIASHYISNFRDRWPLFEECIIPAIID